MITKTSFGRFASGVEDFAGDLILPVGERYEIHPAVDGRWAVVNHTTGRVATVLDSIEDAVEYAKQAETLASK